MKIPKVQLFSDPHNKKAALELAESSLELPFFIDENAFSPVRDTPKALQNAGEIIQLSKVDEFGNETKTYKTLKISPAQKSNYRNGVTRMPDGFLAGIFSEILRVYGYEEFSKRWADYLNDYILHAVPCNPYNVFTLIRGATINFKLAQMPDHDHIVAMKVIGRWNNDMKDGSTWCLTPDDYNLSCNRKVYADFQKYTKISGQVARSLIKLRKHWTARDAWPAMMWCIATGVSPVRLLNFCGHWMTHRDNQPSEFSAQNPATQEHEIELRSKGRVIDYETAKPQFSAGFLLKFATLIGEITWFNDAGQFKEVVTEDLIGFCNCFIMEDFYICGGLAWQEAPLTQVGRKYYEDSGVSNINPETVKEITVIRADRLEAINEAKQKRSRSSNTGNPLFDMQVMRGDDE